MRACPRDSRNQRRAGGLRHKPSWTHRELVGTIAGSNGEVPVGSSEWLQARRGVSGCSRVHLAAVPDLHEEVSLISIDAAVAAVPVPDQSRRPATVRLARGAAGAAAALPADGAPEPLLSPAIAMAWRVMSGQSGLTGRDLLPTPARLLMLAIAVHWLASLVRLPLLARQFWFSTSVLNRHRVDGLARHPAQRRRRTGDSTPNRRLSHGRRRLAPVAGAALRDIIVIFVGVSSCSATSASIRRRRSPASASAASPWRSRRRRHSRT